MLKFPVIRFFDFLQRPMPCMRGEYIGTYQGLSSEIGIPCTTLKRLMQKLSEAGWIKITRLSKGISVYLYGYGAFIGSSMPGKKAKSWPNLKKDLKEE
jgi:DNA-binding IclR family transcriptional regulator